MGHRRVPKTGPVRRMAARLRRLRRVRRLSQATLAAKAGLHRQFITRLEGALHTPSLTTLDRLARALQVPVSDLLR